MTFTLSVPEVDGEVMKQEQRVALEATVRTLQQVFEEAQPEDLLAVTAILTRAAQEPPQREEQEAKDDVVTHLSGGHRFSAAERLALEADALRRSFTYRQALLSDSLTVAEVAALLGTS